MNECKSLMAWLNGWWGRKLEAERRVTGAERVKKIVWHISFVSFGVNWDEKAISKFLLPNSEWDKKITNIPRTYLTTKTIHKNKASRDQLTVTIIYSNNFYLYVSMRKDSSLLLASRMFTTLLITLPNHLLSSFF